MVGICSGDSFQTREKHWFFAGLFCWGRGLREAVQRLWGYLWAHPEFCGGPVREFSAVCVGGAVGWASGS
ncbi:MAG TPA: hypothetical protein DCX79_00455 [Planctomycetaceae bacterium]|nr:hypothetical protein [Planctomycetaceae bacterium]